MPNLFHFTVLFLTLVSCGRAQFLPTLKIEPVAIIDPAALAGVVSRINGKMQELHGIPFYVRVYASFDGENEVRDAFALYPSADPAGIEANQRLFATNPAFAELKQQYDELAKTGPATMLKAVRFDGTHAPGRLSNTLLKVSDESALLSQVRALAELLAATDRGPPKINVFRVFVGEPGWTHLVSINAGSDEHLADSLERLEASDFAWSSDSAELVRTRQYIELSP